LKILLIQGANMEYLGFRQPELYGSTTAAELDETLRQEANLAKIDLDIFYTNLEGEAISAIFRAKREHVDGLLMKPAGFLYAGYALRDCLKAVQLPYIELHMTNIDARGMHSVMASEASGMITGLGIESYRLGLLAIQRMLHKTKS